MGASMVTSIYVLVILVVLGVFIVGVLQLNQMKIIEKIQQNIFLRYSFDFADKIPQLNLSKTEKYYLPEKVNRFFDTLSLQKGISKLLLDVPTASVQIIFGLLLLALYHPLFIMFDILLVVVLYLILKLTSQKGFSSSMEISNYKYEVAAWLQDLARMVKAMKLSFGSNFNLIKTDSSISGYLNARTKHFKILMFQYKTLVAFKVLITTAMLTVGTYLLIEQRLGEVLD
jgi:ABC-type bacteriocin/lantibiotic exporter with double-glycine peptidase domain